MENFVNRAPLAVAQFLVLTVALDVPRRTTLALRLVHPIDGRRHRIGKLDMRRRNTPKSRAEVASFSKRALYCNI